MKYTRNNLKKIETLFKELDYTIRYEKGNFQSGYCIVENRNIAVINKFFDVEARMNVLFEIAAGLEVDQESLTDASLKVYKEVSKQFIISTEEE